MKIDKTTDIFTIAGAAEHSHVSRQAIYVAIKNGRLMAEKRGNKWFITPEALEDYRINKYNRNMRKINGELIFDMEKGFFSTSQVLTILSDVLKRPFNSQRLYYLLRSGSVPAFRCGSAWVIKKEDVIQLCEKETKIQKDLNQYFMKLAN